jgi:hypothetical protein
MGEETVEKLTDKHYAVIMMRRWYREFVSICDQVFVSDVFSGLPG